MRCTKCNRGTTVLVGGELVCNWCGRISRTSRHAVPFRNLNNGERFYNVSDFTTCCTKCLPRGPYRDNFYFRRGNRTLYGRCAPLTLVVREADRLILDSFSYN